MFDKRMVNSFGVASLLLSLSSWFAFLPKSIPGVRLVRSGGVGTHVVLWGVALLLSLPAVLKGSRWWVVAMILPFLNFVLVVLVIGLGEWMASRPG